jgi:hypothetical protein
MTDIDALAAQRLAADEARITGSRRTNVSLREAWRRFWKAPSPWLIGGSLAIAVVGRAVSGAGSPLELLIPVALIAAFPLIEWSIHVAILHWKPRRVGPVEIDSLLARKHREHHADPRDLPLVFIPTRALFWLLPTYAVIAWLTMPTTTSMWSLLVSVYGIKFGYEWVHYLVHSDYRPVSRWFRHVWRNHRLHHYKNEHYWFGVTTAGTADRLLHTYPEPGSVKTSDTVKDLHALEASRESATP